MATFDTTPSPESPEGLGRFAAWSGLIPWLLGAIVAGVVVSLALAGVRMWTAKSKEAALSAAWDEVNAALKNKSTSEDQIAALEGVFPKVSGTAAGPFVALELAQAHFTMYQDSSLPEEKKQLSLDASRKLYDLAMKEWPDNPAFNASAAEGAALCRLQGGNLDGAIQILKEAVGKYEKHSLYPELCYELGLSFWTRVQKKEAASEDTAGDRADARNWLDKAIAEVSRDAGPPEGPGYRYSWLREARYLKALLEPKGPAFKGGLVLPPKAPPAANAPTENAPPFTGNAPAPAANAPKGNAPVDKAGTPRSNAPKSNTP